MTKSCKVISCRHAAMSINMSGHAHFGLQRLYDNKYNRHYMESLIYKTSFLNDTEKDLTFPLCLSVINNSE
jgi:hypothetical protein